MKRRTAEPCVFFSVSPASAASAEAAPTGTAVSEAAYRCKESFETGKMLPIR